MVYSVKITTGLKYKTANSLQKMDCYRAVRSGRLPTIVMYPGSGFASIEAKKALSTIAVAKEYAKLGYCVFVVGYRGYSPYTNIETLHDTFYALIFAKKQSYVDPNNVIAWGGSAGGNLAAWTGIYQQVKAVIGFCPITNLVGFESPLTGWLNGASPSSLSPKSHLIVGTKPHFLVHGTNDTIVPYAQSVEYKAALNALGISCSLFTHNGDHGPITDPTVAAKEWTDEKNFVKQYIGI